MSSAVKEIVTLKEACPAILRVDKEEIHMQIPIISSSILICLVLLTRCCFRNKVRAVWIYALWGLVALRLLVPVQFFSFPAASVMLFGGEENFSVYNSEALKIGDILVYDFNVREKTEREAEHKIESKKREEVFVTEEIGKNEEPGFYGENVQEEEKSQIGDTQTQITDGKIRVRNMMFLVWLSVAGGMFVLFLAVNFHMSHRLRMNREALENKARPLVYLSGSVSVPCLYGFFRPAVYLTKAGVIGDDTVKGPDKAQNQREALDKAVTEVIKQDFSGEMATSSSWQYHGVKYGNIVEAHTTIAKIEKENEVTVYLAYMVGAYGIGEPENKPEKCYELRGGERRFAALTFEKEDGKYVLKEFWTPEDGEELKKDLQKKFPASVNEEKLSEYRYYHYLTSECHRQALEFLKASETGGQSSDKAEISKLKVSDVKFVEISTGRGQTVRIFSEKASSFVKKLVSAYNKMKLVPVTNIKENALDVKQSVTLNFYTMDSSHPEQVIFDGKKICWIHGEPKAWVMDEQYFDHNGIMEKAESQQRHEKIEYAGSRKIQDPYRGPLRLVCDYGSEKKLYRSLLSHSKYIPVRLVKARARAMSIEKGIGYYDEYQSELNQFITIKKTHLLA